MLGILKIIGNDFDSVKFKRKDKVIPLSVANSSIKIDEVAIPIDPLLLFQKMCIAKKLDEELQEYLQFELAPFPLSLFSEEGMRKTLKSFLYKAFLPLTGDMDFGSSIHVIDGGYLLHRFLWHRNESFASICANYVQYVQTHYGSNAVVIFDGYPTDAAGKSTKSSERLRRSKTQTSADIHFEESMVATVSQETFLSNETNKIRLISMLKKKFEDSNFTVKQATEDADTLIVNTAISMSSSFDSVFIIGEDIDLLVLLTALARTFKCLL
ncbi:hypothetical protein RF55_18200 [Lasius niger]|uniref:Uncharacterized protein n=1 Tax=Lasius niger TaxID=67767 RepID=A0A0J7K1Z8_LASNI|nr:hypothetical protein RF55_18200 [Lasius niger]